MKNKTSQGFTLIEIIIVIIVIAILGAISAEIIGNASKIYSGSIKKQNFLKTARSSFSKISREVTWQKSYASFNGSNNKKVNILSNDSKLYNFEIINSNNIIYNNNQVSGANNEILANNISFDNSYVFYLDYSGNVIDILSNNHLIECLKLDFQFNDQDHSLRLTGYSLPYNLRLGRAMSYHE